MHKLLIAQNIRSLDRFGVLWSLGVLAECHLRLRLHQGKPSAGEPNTDPVKHGILLSVCLIGAQVEFIAIFKVQLCILVVEMQAIFVVSGHRLIVCVLAS